LTVYEIISIAVPATAGVVSAGIAAWFTYRGMVAKLNTQAAQREAAEATALAKQLREYGAQLHKEQSELRESLMLRIKGLEEDLAHCRQQHRQANRELDTLSEEVRRLRTQVAERATVSAV
jgi:uncharacterized protein HemX